MSLKSHCHHTFIDWSFFRFLLLRFEYCILVVSVILYFALYKSSYILVKSFFICQICKRLIRCLSVATLYELLVSNFLEPLSQNCIQVRMHFFFYESFWKVSNILWHRNQCCFFPIVRIYYLGLWLLPNASRSNFGLVKLVQGSFKSYGYCICYFFFSVIIVVSCKSCTVDSKLIGWNHNFILVVSKTVPLLQSTP